MKNPRSRHAVRDGTRVLRFEGDLLVRLTSQRYGAPRWSEIGVYRLPGSGYVIEKIGRSSVTHDPDCALVRRDMPAWADARDEERSLPRTPCLECLPDLTHIDAQCRLERTLFQGFVVPDADAVVELLTEDRDRVPALIRRVLDEAAQADPELEKAWSGKPERSS